MIESNITSLKSVEKINKLGLVITINHKYIYIMIKFSKSGYSKFIKGELTSSNIKVGLMAPGLDDIDMTNVNITSKRNDANSSAPTFALFSYNAVYYPNDYEFRINCQFTVDSQNFTDPPTFESNNKIDNRGVLLDSNDSEDFLGSILLYEIEPISYIALNSAPVNFDYRENGLAKLNLRNSSNDNVGRAALKYAYDDTFANGLINLPFFDSGKTVNLLTDLRVALLSTSITPASFVQDIFTKSQTLSSLKQLADSTNYTLLSGGFEFNGLGVSNNLPGLTALDTTIYIPSVTINTNSCFFVIYYETSDITDFNVNSANYQENSFLICPVSQLAESNVILPKKLYPFKQSKILDTAVTRDDPGGGTLIGGILSFTQYVGPWN